MVVVPGAGRLPGVLVDLRLEVGVEPTELGGDLVGNAQEQGVDHIVLPDQRLLERPLPDEGKVQQEVLQAQDLVQRLLALGRQAADAVAARTLEAALLHQDLHGVLLAGGQEPGQGCIVVLAEEGQLSGLEDAVSPGGRLQDGVERVFIARAARRRADQAQARVFRLCGEALLDRLQTAVADEPQEIGPQNGTLFTLLAAHAQAVGHVQVAPVGCVPEIRSLLHQAGQLGLVDPAGNENDRRHDRTQEHDA